MRKSVWKKRIVSLLTVSALILALWSYSAIRINALVNEKHIYVASVDIPPRTEITEDMIAKHTMPSRGIPLNAITDPNKIVGKWTVAGYGISSTGFFYEDKIVEKKELPDAGLLDLKENEVAIPLLVDLETSLGNSIIPDTKLDLYFRDLLHDQNNPKVLLGPLASNIRVVAVKNAQASDVFDVKGNKDSQSYDATKTENNTMAKIYIFAVPEELSDLVNKAKMLGEVFPLATGQSYKMGLETMATENEVVTYIEQATYTLESENTELEGETGE